VVDTLLSGTHEPGTSHYQLLRAFVPDAILTRIDAELESGHYRSHEFGDSLFIDRARRSAFGGRRSGRKAQLEP